MVGQRPPKGFGFLTEVSMSNLRIYIEKHKKLWEMMRNKYEFMDKTVDFEESVIFTKDLLDKEISNLDKIKSLKIRLR